MIKCFRVLFQNELVKYLIAGVLTTLVYFIARISLFYLLNEIISVTIISSTIAILFAFWINDSYVFESKKSGWQKRLVAFFSSRLLTMGLDVVISFLLIEAFPEILIGVVGGSLNRLNMLVTLLNQIVILIGNYVISKFFVFRKTS
ncbi:GtrA family protein [Streptococcus suis]